MANKTNMTPYEASLFNELKKLSKQANQRIVRLERLTKTKNSFAVKQLKDYLTSSKVNTWTKKTKSRAGGRVGVSKKYTAEQMEATIKAVKNFLKAETSRVAGVKQYKQKQEKIIGKKITYKKLSTLYKAEQNYKWIYEYFGTSERSGGNYFWDFAREFKNVDFDTWCDNIMVYITDRSLDAKLKKDLQSLYNYAKGVK